MQPTNHLSKIRREYGEHCIDDSTFSTNPIVQFQYWFAEVLSKAIDDPTAMILSTVDEQGYPDSRVVLLKGIEENGFIFYTNYQSIKGIHLQKTPYGALNFYWPSMVRQVRIRGSVKKISPEQSDHYFLSRPIESQLSAICSPQSQGIPSRSYLENLFKNTVKIYEQKPITRPKYWGGYCLFPNAIEFWQGSNHRLHDRIYYFKDQGIWKRQRLAP